MHKYNELGYKKTTILHQIREDSNANKEEFIYPVVFCHIPHEKETLYIIYLT